MSKNRFRLPAAMVVGTTMLMGSAAHSAVESTDPIVLTLHDWTGQYITTTIMGRVLQEMGYNIKYQQADYLAQFAGLESGDLHIAMEMWETTGKDAMEKSLATGNTVDLGETGMQAIEEWWYPLYMKEQCPGLPDWNALNECAEIFSTAETAPSGRYLGGPVTWGGYDDERVEALELDYEVVHAGTDAALFAELESAYQRKAPWLGWVYTPHWAPIKFEGEFVEFPPYSDACYSDKHWAPIKFEWATPATVTSRWASTRIWPMIVASHGAGLKRWAGKEAKKNGLAPTMRSDSLLLITMPWGRWLVKSTSMAKKSRRSWKLG